MTEPFIFNSAGELVEDDETRRRRELARQLMGDLPELDQVQVPAPQGDPARDPAEMERLRTAAPSWPGGMGRAAGAPTAAQRRLPQNAAEAARVGDAYRASLPPDHPGAETARRGAEDIYGSLTTERDRPAAQPAAPAPPSPLPASRGASSLGRELSAPSPPIQQMQAPRIEAQGAARPLASPVDAAVASPPPSGQVPPQSSEARRQLEQVRALMAERRARGAAPQSGGRDYTGADTADVIRRIFHALGAGLLAGAGRQAPAFRSEGERLREQDRRSALESMRQAQQADAQRLRERGLEAQIADRDRRAQLDEMRFVVGAQQAQLRAENDRQRTESLVRLRAARGEIAQEEARRLLALMDPGSPETQSMRAEVQNDLATLRGELGFEPPAQVMQWLETAPGDAIGRYRDFIRQSGVLRPRTSRHGRGRGGGGTGGGGSGSPQTVQQLERELAEAGVPESSVDLSTPRGRERARAELRMRTRPADRDELNQRVERYGTARQRMQIPTARAALRGVVRQLDQSAPGWREGGDIPGLGATGMVPRALLSTEGRDIRGAMDRLLDTQLRAATGANAPESEVRTFRDILGVGSLSTDRDFRAALQRAEQYLEDQDAELIRTYGEDAANEWRTRSADAARQQPGERVSTSQQAQPRPQPSSEMVRVISPSGEHGSLPASRLQRALERGYRRADGGR